MLDLSERKRTERREAILACAEGVFSERGFDATPMEGIAACADISPATLSLAGHPNPPVVAPLIDTAGVE